MLINENSKTQVTFSAKLREFENWHIVFWLIKDMSWAMGWRLAGVLMIFPTLTLSVYLTWKFRKTASELFHNLAVICWIFANSYWMISEFYGFEEKEVIAGIRYVHFALIPFITGLLLVVYYHLFFRNSKK